MRRKLFLSRIEKHASSVTQNIRDIDRSFGVRRSLPISPNIVPVSRFMIDAEYSRATRALYLKLVVIEKSMVFTKIFILVACARARARVPRVCRASRMTDDDGSRRYRDAKSTGVLLHAGEEGRGGGHSRAGSHGPTIAHKTRL